MSEKEQDSVILTAGDRVSRRLRYRHDRSLHPAGGLLDTVLMKNQAFGGTGFR